MRSPSKSRYFLSSIASAPFQKTRTEPLEPTHTDACARLTLLQSAVDDERGRVHAHVLGRANERAGVDPAERRADRRRAPRDLALLAVVTASSRPARRRPRARTRAGAPPCLRCRRARRRATSRRSRATRCARARRRDRRGGACRTRRAAPRRRASSRGARERPRRAPPPPRWDRLDPTRPTRAAARRTPPRRARARLGRRARSASRGATAPRPFARGRGTRRRAPARPVDVTFGGSRRGR